MYTDENVFEGGFGWSALDGDGALASFLSQVQLSNSAAAVRVIVVRPGETEPGRWKVKCYSNE